MVDYKYRDKLEVLKAVVLRLGDRHDAEKRAFLADIRQLRTKVDVADLYEKGNNPKNKVKDYEQALFQEKLSKGAPGRTFQDYQIEEAKQFHEFEQKFNALNNGLRELLADGPIDDSNQEKHRLFHKSVEAACKAQASKNMADVEKNLGALKPLIDFQEPNKKAGPDL